MWKKNNNTDESSFKYTIVDDVDYIVDESANTTINFRKLYWGDRSENVKIDIRKYYHDENGEHLGKGFSFLTEDGPDTLVHTMIDIGYGKTANILNSIKDREDFQKALNTVLGKDSEFYDDSVGVDEEYFDPKMLLD